MSIATLGNVANLHMSCYKTATYLYICPNTNTCQYKGKCCQTTYELVQDTQIQMKTQSLFWWSWKISLGPLDVRYQRWSLKSAVLVRMREVTGFFGGGTNWPLFTNIQDLLRQPGRPQGADGHCRLENISSIKLFTDSQHILILSKPGHNTWLLGI